MIAQLVEYFDAHQGVVAWTGLKSSEAVAACVFQYLKHLATTPRTIEEY
jgi:hypothetical protein